MKLSIVRGGGVAGVTTRTELDESVLSADDARTLRAKVTDAEAELGKAGSEAADRHPDELQYEVTVADGQTTRTMRVGDATLPEPVRSLIAWVDTHPQRTTRVLPPGSG